MRIGGLLKILTVLAALTALFFGAGSYLSFRDALAAKLDRTAQIERQAVRPAAAARLAAALLERRLASVSEPASRAVAAAFQHSDASTALADYRAAGGDPALAAEAERMLGEKAPTPQAEIALMRAIRGLRAEAAAAPHSAPPAAPASASHAGRRLLEAGVSAGLAVVFAYLAGRWRTGSP